MAGRRVSCGGWGPTNPAATDPAGAGYLTAFPCGVRPLASNVNYTRGATVANSAQVLLSPAGELCLYSLAPVDVVVDVTGVWRTA